MIKSKQTKNMTPEELKELQERVKAMTPEEVKAFRNSHDPDKMGFQGEEAI